jgi:hypothetical protein
MSRLHNLVKVVFKEAVFLTGNQTYEKVINGTESGFEWMDLMDGIVRIKVNGINTLVPFSNVEWATEEWNG